MMQYLETARLVLRPLADTDVDDFYYYAQNPAVSRYLSWSPHESREEAYGILQKLKANNEFAIVAKEDRRMIGTIGFQKSFRQRENVRSLGFALNDEYWNEGLMTEALGRLVRHAFEDLGLDMLDGICATANTASRRVFEKNGFHLDGTLPQVIENNAGDILDAHFFSQSRDAWRQAHQKV